MVHPKSEGNILPCFCSFAKWGMNERKTFPTEKEALDYAREIAEQYQITERNPQSRKKSKSKRHCVRQTG